MHWRMKLIDNDQEINRNMNLSLMAATTTTRYTRFNEQSLLPGLHHLVMKCLVTLGLALLMFPAWAQDDDDVPAAQDPNVKSKIQAARVAYITDQLALTPEEAEKFWPIYREFSAKLKELRLQLRDAKLNPDPKKSTEQNDQALVDQQFDIKQKELNLEKDYSTRLLKVISAQKLRTLPDAERRFRQMILEQIQRRQQQQERQRTLRDQSQKKLQDRNN